MAIERHLSWTIATACDSVRHVAYLGGYILRRKSTYRYGTLATDGFQGPPEANYGQGFNDEWSYAVSNWVGRGRHGRHGLIAS